MKILKGVFVMGILAALTGCGRPSLTHYKDSKPPLDLKAFFTGHIKGWGIVQDWNGNVKTKFDVVMNGTWEGEIGTLEERFTYYDGKTQDRTWVIRKIEDGKYEGTAGDIIGKAKGIIAGNAMQWKYEMDLTVEGSTYRITFDDWMFQMNDGVLINRSYLRKFGFTVGELTLFMQKQVN